MDFRIDALLPADMATKAEQGGIKKANMDFSHMFILAILAGAFIALGGVFATAVAAGSSVVTAADGSAALAVGLPYGVVRLLSGVAFSLGLILVVVAGAGPTAPGDAAVRVDADGQAAVPCRGAAIRRAKHGLRQVRARDFGSREHAHQPDGDYGLH